MTSIADGKARLIRDDNKAELVVLVNNLVLKTSDYSRQQLKIEKHDGQIKKFDLIGGSDEKTVGVVISMDTNNLFIVDLSGVVKKVSRLQVKSIIKKTLSVKNKYGQDIQKKFTVKVLGGVFKDHVASVEHVYDDFVFVRDKAYSKNEGIYVIKADQCYVLDSKQISSLSYQGRFNSYHQKQEMQPPERTKTRQ